MNEKGFALVTVLVLGSISMLLVALGTYMVSSGTLTSGIQKRYQSELQIATGAAELIMSQLVLETLKCTAAQTACTAGDEIYLSPTVCTALDKPGCINLSATFLSSNADPADLDKTLVSTKIISRSGGSGNESAIIDIVFKIE